uniref:Uncharacterized protein n=1 Tax=Arundo donax TaxID=35708 RepID=A0A0A9GHG2_ARUDO
MEEWGFCFHVS